MKSNANVVWLQTRSQHVPPGFNPGTLVSTGAPRLAQQQARHQGEFLRGPIPIERIKRAKNISPLAVPLLLAIYHQTNLRRSEWVVVSLQLLNKFGLSWDHKKRYLKCLAEAGLIEIDKQGKGRSHPVRLASQSPVKRVQDA
jgi:DNA-binding transcriptional ArsR family regulator